MANEPQGVSPTVQVSQNVNGLNITTNDAKEFRDVQKIVGLITDQGIPLTQENVDNILLNYRAGNIDMSQFTDDLTLTADEIGGGKAEKEKAGFFMNLLGGRATGWKDNLSGQQHFGNIRQMQVSIAKAIGADLTENQKQACISAYNKQASDLRYGKANKIIGENADTAIPICKTVAIGSAVTVALLGAAYVAPAALSAGGRALAFGGRSFASMGPFSKLLAVDMATDAAEGLIDSATGLVKTTAVVGGGYLALKKLQEIGGIDGLFKDFEEWRKKNGIENVDFLALIGYMLHTFLGIEFTPAATKQDQAERDAFTEKYSRTTEDGKPLPAIGEPEATQPQTTEVDAPSLNETAEELDKQQQFAKSQRYLDEQSKLADERTAINKPTAARAAA